MARSTAVLFSAFLLPTLVHAVNDWSTPCTSGSCSWNVPSSTGSSVGLTIQGSSNAISDITLAAGWEILNCTSNGTTTEVRLVCASADTSANECSHLTQNGGAVNKIVRLPDNCGTGPFARVASESISSDQSIPSQSAARRRRRRRANALPLVQTLLLDTNWHQIPTSSNGNVSLIISGANIPSASGSSRRRSRIMSNREINGPVPSLVRRFNETENINLPPINVNKNFNIFNQSLTCGDAKASVDVSVNTQANAQMNVGVIAIGSVVPPALTSFELVAAGNANLNGTLSFGASASGKFDSGLLTLLQTDLPGFDIPGIFSLSPAFQITGQATAQLDLDVNLKIPLSYNVQNLQVFFPPSSAYTSSANANPLESPVQLSVSSNAGASGSAAVHLTPTLTFGVEAFDNEVSANIFVDLNAGLAITLSGDASPSAQVNIGGSNAESVVSQLGNNAAASGCADVEGTITGNAGADGSFFDLFNKTTTIPIFSKSFQVVKGCSNKATASNAVLGKRQTQLSCPLSGIVQAADQILSHL